MNDFAEEYITTAETGDVERMTYLLDHEGVDINYRSISNEHTALLMACTTGQDEFVKLLLRRNINVHATVNQKTALHLVAGDHNHEIMKMLLRTSIDIDARDDTGHTALHDIETIPGLRLFLEYGIDIDAVVTEHNATYYQCSLFEILFQFHSDDSLEMLKMLLTFDADINGKKARLFIEQGETIRARQTPIGATIFSETPDVLQYLCDHGINIYQFDYLYEALDQGDIGTLSILVDRGHDVVHTKWKKQPINPNYPRDFYDNTLLIAVNSYYSRLAKVKYLIEKGVDIDFRGLFGETAFMVAVEHDYLEEAEVLYKAGANVNTLYDSHQSILHIVLSSEISEKEKLKLTHWLVNRGVRTDLIDQVS